MLREESDTNRRLAMILIDNAVELTAKTFLGLPKRVTGVRIPRKELQDIGESFPAMLDALEKYAGAKLSGIDLGEIEWYHRLRNQLYHQGNGLTVERDKVEVYSQLANILFARLFGVDLVHASTSKEKLLGQFLTTWIELEAAILSLGDAYSSYGGEGLRVAEVLKFLRGTTLVSKADIREFEKLRHLRNSLVHGMVDQRTLTGDVLRSLRSLLERFKNA